MGKLRLLAALFIATTAFAATDIRSVNNAIKDVLREFQTAETQAKVTIKEIQPGPNDQGLSLVGNYKRTAGGLEVALKLTTFTYDRQGSAAPLVVARGNLGFDPYELWGEEPTREWVDDLQKEILDRFKKSVEAYGDAAQVTGKVKSLTQQAEEGQKPFPGVRARAVTEIDIEKISSRDLRRGLLLQRVELRFDVTNKGIPFELKMTLNPQYSGFVDNQKSLSDFLVNLNKADRSALQTIYNFAQYIDRFTLEALRTRSPKPFLNLLPNRK